MKNQKEQAKRIEKNPYKQVVDTLDVKAMIQVRGGTGQGSWEDK